MGLGVSLRLCEIAPRTTDSMGQSISWPSADYRRNKWKMPCARWLTKRPAILVNDVCNWFASASETLHLMMRAHSVVRAWGPDWGGQPPDHRRQSAHCPRLTFLLARLLSWV